MISHLAYQEDNFQKTSCKDSVLCVSGGISSSDLNHFLMQSYSQERQQKHHQDDYLIKAFSQGVYSAKVSIVTLSTKIRMINILHHKQTVQRIYENN